MKSIGASEKSQYMLYALGEILLVVVGILIALQINNWNENKIDVRFEKDILLQIHENLLQDQANLQDIQYWQNKALISSDKLINDSIRFHNMDSIAYWLGDVVHFSRFQPLTNSYEALKSAGIQKLSNKELRNNIGVYYDDQANLAIKALGDIEYAFFHQWLPLMEDHVDQFHFQEFLVVKDMERFFTETNALRILTLNRDNISASIRRLENTLKTLNETLDLMPEDLETSSD